MIANGTPVVVMKNIKGHPLDFGKFFIDKKRLFGDSKTFEGFFSGLLVGSIVGLILGLFCQDTYNFVSIVVTSVASSLGAMIGDLIKSFFKRRLGIESGGKLPVADQLDFYLGANLFLLLLPHTIKPKLSIFVLGLIVIPMLHVLTNRLAFKSGLKKVPY